MEQSRTGAAFRLVASCWALGGVGAVAWMTPQLSADASTRPHILPKPGPIPGQPLVSTA